MSSPALQKSHRLLTGDCFKQLDKIVDKSCRLLITSPPYNIGKAYERDSRRSLQEYKDWLSPIVKKSVDKVSDDGNVCWQVGNYVNNGEIVPLDYIIYEMMSDNGCKLRNRIIWHFNFGLNAQRRFSGRYETLLWFSISDNYRFALDPIRVPQLYPGKRHSAQHSKAGKPSGNPNGKNPGDFWVFDPERAFKEMPIWDVPNVKANHPEKTFHPCQFPSELVERCVLALTDVGDTVLDPFVGVGTSVIAAAKHGRVGVGIDRDKSYIAMARKRLALLCKGSLATRPLGAPVRRPRPTERVAKIPAEWTPAAE